MGGLVGRMEDHITVKETESKWLSNTTVDSWTKPAWMSLIKDSQEYNTVLLTTVTMANYSHQTNYSHSRSPELIHCA